MTFALLMIVRAITGLRVKPRIEYEGLDLALHGETIAEPQKVRRRVRPQITGGIPQPAA